MKIIHLELINFRNHTKSEFKFSDSVNIFIGNNAQGKTNILEAIHILCTAKSFRTHKDDELIQIGESNARIIASAISKEINRNFNIYYPKNEKKTLMLNGKKIMKYSSFIGSVNVSVLCPEDILLIQGDASYRRRFIDIILCQIDKVYLDYLTRYHKVIKHKNHQLKLIKSGKGNMTSLDPWNEQIEFLSPLIFKKRSDFVMELNIFAHNIHYFLTNSSESIDIRYINSVSNDIIENERAYAEALKVKQKKISSEEVMRGMALIGPHRDELRIRINNISAKHFGSQGQQRTTAISMRLAEMEYLRQQMSEYPILLIDDIFSELDDNRKTFLMQLLNCETQMFLTGTRISEFSALADRARIFNIRKGKVVDIPDETIVP